MFKFEQQYLGLWDTAWNLEKSLDHCEVSGKISETCVENFQKLEIEDRKVRNSEKDGDKEKNRDREQNEKQKEKREKVRGQIRARR